MKRPPKSEAVRKAARERNILTFRWTIAMAAGVVGLLAGGFVFYWIIEMEQPYRPPGDSESGGLTVWWYEFAQRWKVVIASAASGTLWVLLPTLTFPERRKETATRSFASGITAILFYGVAIAWARGFPVWETTLPAFLCSLGMNLLLGIEFPSVKKKLLIRRHAPSALPASPDSELDSSEVWRLRHTSTQEQFLDDAMALHFLSGDLTTYRVLRSIAQLALALFVFFLIPADYPQLKYSLMVVAVIYVIISWIRYVPRIRRKILEAYVEKFGLSFPVQEAWELNESALVCHLQETVTEIPWSDLQEVKELQDGFHMRFTKKEHRAFLPYRAFPDSKEQRRWGTRIKSHLLSPSA